MWKHTKGMCSCKDMTCTMYMTMTYTIPTAVATEPTNQQTQEQMWARAAQAGDQTAFMHLVDAYQRPVYNLCYRMLNNGPEAEDAAQETFLRAYTKIKTYNSNRKFSSWLLTIASNHCIDRIRKRRHQMVSWDDLPPRQIVPAHDPQPEQAALANESQALAHDLLDTLPPDYRAAVVLRYWHDMAYDEIAETMETSVSAIKSRLFRARQMMAKTMQEREKNDPVQ